MVKNLPKLMKDTKPPIQEVLQSPRNIKSKQKSPMHTVKLLQNKNKEKY